MPHLCLSTDMSLQTDEKLKPILVIPARMASARLPGKPLADIGGVPMVVRVMQRATAADVGPVIVACAQEEIADAVRCAGGKAVLTDPDLPSGTDRVRAAVNQIDPDGAYNCVVNVQGDMPVLDPEIVRTVIAVLAENPDCHIATLVSAIENEGEINDPNVVKAVISMVSDHRGRALYFTRAAAPTGPGIYWHHVGIYAYRRDVLDRFCQLPPSPLEIRERLEQLRALEAGLRIDIGVITNAVGGVDTKEDLARARAVIMEQNGGENG